MTSVSPYEPHLVPATVDSGFLADLPTRLIGDRGYDSDTLDATLMAEYGIEMIAAHRKGRPRQTQPPASVVDLGHLFTNLNLWRLATLLSSPSR